MYIPPGFNTVTPYFFVDNAEAFVRFLIEGLGGTETHRALRPDGKIANAQVRLGTSTVMVSEASAAYPAMAAAYYLYVDDAQTSMDRALAHGATLEMAVADMPYGDRQGGIRDAHGNIWWISQRIVPGPYQAYSQVSNLDNILGTFHGYGPPILHETRRTKDGSPHAGRNPPDGG